MTRNSLIVLGLVACTGLCANSALAQPAVFEDLGTLPTGSITSQILTSRTAALTATGIRWYRFTLPAPANASNSSFLDLYTTAAATGSLSNADSEIGLYTNTGAFIATDDDDGAGAFSALSFGLATPTRPANGTSLIFNGRDGANVLPAGTYWLAVGAFNSTFTTGAGANWTVTSTATATGNVNLFLSYGINAAITSPTGVAAITGSPVCNASASTVKFAVTVTPGANPTSTGLLVTADLSTLGAGAAVALNDTGTNGDLVAGDGIYSVDLAIPAAATPGTFATTFAISDAQARTASGSFPVVTINSPATPPTVVGDLGDLSLPAQVTRTFDLPALGVQWYSFTLSSPVSAGSGTFLDIDTAGSAGCPDTEIGLFSAANCGSFITTDDDSGPGFLSQLSFGAGSRPAPAQGTCTSVGIAYAGGATLPAGTYYVAVGMFNTNFAAPYTATSTSGPATTGVVLNLRSTASPSNPTGTGLATPSTAVNDGTGSVNLRVTVTPGSFPTSTGHTVTVNGTGIGAGTVTLLDDGVAPDAVAGDNIFNGTATVANGTAVGSTPLPFTITSSDARVGSGNIALTVREPSGACCIGGAASILTASACATSGGTFRGDGSSALGTGTLYTSADPFPIAIPDNVPATPGTSTITITDTTTITSIAVKVGLTHTFVGDLIGTLSNGTTTVTMFSRVGGGSDLAGTYNFADAATVPFGTGVSPLASGDYLPAGTGSGPLSAFAGSSIAGTWTLTVSDNAGLDVGTIDSFTIDLNPTPCAVACLADIAGGPTGGPDGIVDGSDFIAFINAFAAADPLADLAGGPTGGPDGIVDGSDFIAFINAFAAGC